MLSNALIQLVLDASILELNVHVGKFLYESSKNFVKWVQTWVANDANDAF